MLHNDTFQESQGALSKHWFQALHQNDCMARSGVRLGYSERPSRYTGQRLEELRVHPGASELAHLLCEAWTLARAERDSHSGLAHREFANKHGQIWNYTL